MLEILQKNSIDGYENLLEKIDCDKKDILIVESMDNSKVNGYGIFSYNEEDLVIYAFDANDDLMLLDGIIRAMLFKASMKGIDKVTFNVSTDGEINLLKRLHYVNDDGTSIESIADFMNNCRNCKRNN